MTRYYWRRRGAPADIMGPATVPQIHEGLRPGEPASEVETLAAAGQSHGQLKASTAWAALPAAVAAAPPPPVTLTTAQGLEGFRVARTLEVITAECVFGMNVFRDFFASVTDIFGGRSTATQNVLRDARVRCLDELRAEARRLGANAVIAVDLDYSEMSGGGKSMLFLVASGTAVVVVPVAAPAPDPPQYTVPAVPAA